MTNSTKEMTKSRIIKLDFVHRAKSPEGAVVKVQHKEPADVSDIVGSFGPWQKAIWLSVMYFELMGAVANLSSPMLLPDVPFTCDLNHTKHQLMKGGLRPGELSVDETQCFITHRRNRDVGVVPCEKWTYSHETYKHTFTEEWNLVCDRAWLVSFSNTATILGDLLACTIFGYTSDRFGRRNTLMLLLFPVLTGPLVTLLASDIGTFLIGRFFLGAAGHGGLIISFVLLMETVGTSHRATIGISVKLGFTVGGLLLGIVALCLRDSWQLQIVITAACVLLVPIILLLPESPRWLLVSGGEDGIGKASQILRNAAKFNGVQLTDINKKIRSLSNNILEEKHVIMRKYGFTDLVRTRNLRHKTLAVMFLWAVNSFCYYGITLLITRLGVDPAFSFILILVVEFPAYFLINPVAHYKGYKVGMACGYFLNSIVFITSSEAKIESGFGVILVILLAKIGTILCSSCIGNYATEIFPTVVRSLGLGTCTVVSRILALLSPYLKEMAQATSMSSVFALLAGLCLSCLACVMFLPDTFGKSIPETIEDSENTGLMRPWKGLHILRRTNFFRVPSTNKIFL